MVDCVTPCRKELQPVRQRTGLQRRHRHRRKPGDAAYGGEAALRGRPEPGADRQAAWPVDGHDLAPAAAGAGRGDRADRGARYGQRRTSWARSWRARWGCAGSRWWMRPVRGRARRWPRRSRGCCGRRTWRAGSVLMIGWGRTVSAVIEAGLPPMPGRAGGAVDRRHAAASRSISRATNSPAARPS